MLSDCHLSLDLVAQNNGRKMPHHTELQHVSFARGVSVHSSNAIRATAGCELCEVFTAEKSRTHYVLQNVGKFLRQNGVMARMTLQLVSCMYFIRNFVTNRRIFSETWHEYHVTVGLSTFYFGTSSSIMSELRNVELGSPGKASLAVFAISTVCVVVTVCVKVRMQRQYWCQQSGLAERFCI
jgi:hypothetical protein